MDFISFRYWDKSSNISSDVGFDFLIRKEMTRLGPLASELFSKDFGTRIRYFKLWILKQLRFSKCTWKCMIFITYFSGLNPGSRSQHRRKNPLAIRRDRRWSDQNNLDYLPRVYAFAKGGKYRQIPQLLLASKKPPKGPTTVWGQRSVTSWSTSHRYYPSISTGGRSGLSLSLFILCSSRLSAWLYCPLLLPQWRIKTHAWSSITSLGCQ